MSSSLVRRPEIIGPLVLPVPEHLSPQGAEARAEELRLSAEELLQGATARAEEIVREAEGRAESVEAEARARGLEAGRAEAVEQGEELLSLLESLAAALGQARYALVRAVEPKVAELGVVIAEKIIAHELRSAAPVVGNILRSVLDDIPDHEPVVIRLNPADMASVRTSDLGITRLTEGQGILRVVEDREVARGGCLIETGSGLLDCRLETQLEQARQIILEQADEG